MTSYFATLLVLCVIVSEHVIISDKNGTTVLKHDYRHSIEDESPEREHFTETSVLSKIDDLSDTSVISTTSRSVRFNNSSGSTQERDTKLMNLLAARRSALNRDRFRTHRKVITTGKTRVPIETTSRTPSDFRTACVRNCTKNFTRRTTASCMRKCTNNQRTTYSTTTINYISDEETSHKDNNEILFTDESSHGFFVVAKDANDTINHIPNLKKNANLSLGGSTKLRSRGRNNTSISILDTGSHDIFDRRPPLRPSLINISPVSNEHPQVLEISVSQRPFRNKKPSKLNTRERGISPLYRKLVVDKLPTVNESIVKTTTPSAALKNEETPNNTATFVSTSADVTVFNEPESTTVEKGLFSIKSIRPESFVKDKHFSTDTVDEEVDISTPLLITVIENENTSSTTEPEFVTSYATEINEEEWRTEGAKEGFFDKGSKEDSLLRFSDDKTNLIIFVNKSTEIITPAPPPASPFSSGSTRASESNVIVKTTLFSSVRSTIYPSEEEGEEEVITRSPLNDSNKTTESNTRTSLTTTSNIDISQKNVMVPDTKRLNIATYVLAGLGMFPVIIVILYLGRTFILRKYKPHDEDFDVCITDQQPISPIKKKGHYDDDENAKNEPNSMNSMSEFDRVNLRLKSLLGEGNFGQVWKAEADDLSGHIGATRIVAVKTVRSGGAQESLRDEAMIMKKLGSHPNVVTLLGACIESEPHMIIMEFAMRGRLLSLLRAARSATNILPASVPGGKSLAPLSPRTLAGFALDIATGMEYISDKGIVHRDLAARNILIDHNGICKICDFGMSIDLDVQYRENHHRESFTHGNSSKFDKLKLEFEELFINHWNHRLNFNNSRKQHDTLARKPALPIRWMAPESLQYNKFSTKSDVWAFGIVLWELATLGATPYSHLSGREVVRHVLQGTRPEIPKDGRHGFFNLMSKCWHKVPDIRPTFSEARLEISRFICKWIDDEEVSSDYMDVSGFSEDLEHGMVYFNQRISEFECDI